MNPHLSTRVWTAALVVIGDKILSGRTQDRNVAQVATWLNVQGIRLKEVRVIADDMDAIVEAVNLLRARKDYLFTTGGIGPTHGYIIVDAIASALGVEVIIHPKARAILERYYESRGGLNEGQARVPDGAGLIENRMSGALTVLSATLGCWVAGSEVAALLGDTGRAHAGCQIGSYPFFREGRAGAKSWCARSTRRSSMPVSQRWWPDCRPTGAPSPLAAYRHGPGGGG